MSEKKLSQSKKAINARRDRQVNTQRKRFEGPLREFLRIKHYSIYKEYVEFYEELERNHPGKRDLTKTKTFREWTKAVRGKVSEIPVQHIQDKSEAARDESVEIINSEATRDETSEAVASLQESNVDILSVVLQETLNEFEAPVAGNDMIENLISDLERDEAVRSILNPLVDEMLIDEAPRRDDDEGIELNLLDELDIEPFDFDTEVDF